jgi:hypothetical protein
MRADSGGDDGRRTGWPWRAGAARRFTVPEPVRDARIEQHGYSDGEEAW